MVISITPIPKVRMTQSDRWKKRPAVVRYFSYCDKLRELLPDYVVPEVLQIEFGMPMANSWSKKKRGMLLGMPHQQKPDIDNLAKAFMDALCEDDSYIYKLEATKIWSTEGYIKLW